MANLTLDLRINSATDLSNVNIITKTDVYAVVSIHGDHQSRKKLKSKTPVDRVGGSNPTWNHAVKFSVDERLARDGRLTLVVKLICDRVLGDKEIGEVNVPILELLNSNPPSSPRGNGNGMMFVTYQVRTPSGRGKGSLSFSYRFDTGPVKPDLPAPVFPIPAESELPSTAYPPPPPGSVYPHAPAESHLYPPPSQLYGYAPPPSGRPDSLYPDAGKLGEPVTAYPALSAGPSCGPPQPPHHQSFVYPLPADKPTHAYQQTPPPQQPQPGYAYPPPPQPGYGYGYPPPPPGYGYGYPPPPVVKPPKNNKSGLGFGAGLLGGALGGLLIGDMVDDVADGFDF